MANKMAWTALLFGMLIGGAMVMYQEQLRDAFLNTKNNAAAALDSSRQEKVTPHY